MPTTLTGLLIVALLLLPGFAYVAIRERLVPHEQRSGFRETAEVVMVGVIADVAAGIVGAIVYAILRWAWRPGTPEIAQLIRAGREYAADAYLVLAAWLFGLLVVAVVLAVIAACKIPKRGHLSSMSAWWRLFQDRPREIKEGSEARDSSAEVQVAVGCYLQDGTYVAGALHSHSRVTEDSPDRDLVLTKPLGYCTPGTTVLRPLDAHAICISARQITAMTVKYYPPSVSSPGDGAESVEAEGSGAASTGPPIG